MNIRFKDFLLPLAFALVTVWIVQLVIMKYAPGQQPACDNAATAGQSFVAPQTRQELKPLNTEVDFIDTQRATPAVITDVETALGRYIFSTDGATLRELSFKLHRDGQTEIISTIEPNISEEREDRCFLVALETQTPYFYELIDRQENEEWVLLTYRAATNAAVINKTFMVYKKIYKIDVTLNIAPKGNQTVEARIFYPAPHLEVNGAPTTDSEPPLNMAAVVNDEKKIDRIAMESVDTQKGWYAPSLFGGDNRYFSQVLVQDPQHFVKRAYYKLLGKHDLIAIIEGPQIQEGTTWTMSFYFGPKQEDAIRAVDPRLEQTLEYAGWFAIISQFLLKVLNFFYSYVGNYGIAIIILTIIIKLLLMPFTWKTEAYGKKNEEYQRKLTYLQQKYKHDPDQLALERAELVKKHGMPGLSGCLPLLLQIPVFIALSRVLSSSIELYRAPFGFWIKDLSARDPYYILPALVTLCMVGQAMTAPSTQRLPILAMALIFGAVAANFSAGLALYILVNTFLSVVQVVVQRKFKWV